MVGETKARGRICVDSASLYNLESLIERSKSSFEIFELTACKEHTFFSVLFGGPQLTIRRNPLFVLSCFITFF